VSRPDKKQRHKKKREAKRLAARRLDSISPVRRLADARGEIECWVSEDFETFGQMHMFAYKRAAALTGLACFLVDRGVVGLKDAWTRLNIDRAEVDDMLERASGRGIRLRRCTVEELRRHVAGAARWAHDNGMRLPKHWLKSAAVLGGVGDWAAADVSAFVMEFAGEPDDLRQRLIGCPFDEYIQRTDIEFTFRMAAPRMDSGEYGSHDGDEFDDELDAQDDDNIDEAALTQANQAFFEDPARREKIDAILKSVGPAATELAASTTEWLKGRDETPSTELLEAWRTYAAGLFIGSFTRTAPTDVRRSMDSMFLQAFTNRIDSSRFDEYQLAIKQTTEHLASRLHMLHEALARNSPVIATEDAMAQPGEILSQ
jgi:hypothetical protein